MDQSVCNASNGSFLFIDPTHAMYNNSLKTCMKQNGTQKVKFCGVSSRFQTK